MKYDIRKALNELEVPRNKYCIFDSDFCDIPTDEDAICLVNEKYTTYYQVYVKNNKNSMKMFDEEWDSLDYFFSLISKYAKNNEKIPTIHRFFLKDMMENRSHNYFIDLMEIYEKNNLDIIIIDFKGIHDINIDEIFKNSVGRFIKTYGLQALQGILNTDNVDKTMRINVDDNWTTSYGVYCKNHSFETSEPGLFLKRIASCFKAEFNSDPIFKNSEFLFKNNELYLSDALPPFEYNEHLSILNIKTILLEQFSFFGCLVKKFESEKENDKFKQNVCNAINKSLNTSFDQKDMKIIYQNFGFGGNTQLAREFIRSGYDMSLLET